MLRDLTPAALVLAAGVLMALAQSSARAAQYVDPAACRSCHAGIYETYRHSGMARSLYKPAPANTVEDYKTNNSFYHPASDRYYTMFERDGRFFQRRHQVDAAGKPVNVIEREVHYVIGSGNHARSYLHRTEQNRLIQLPATWYAERGGFWDMSPGYDWEQHQDFRRKITMECLFCHNAYPKIAKETDRVDQEAVFAEELPEGIDCQRCHGPGGDHVRGFPNSIVNPAKLSRERNIEVCMQCHLETTSMPLPYSVRRFGRGVFSYRPGEALSGYMIHFDHAPNTGHEDKFEIAGAAYRLRQSLCFQKSGTLTCTTCHNPHDIPRGEAATRHYTSVCQSCHVSGANASPTGRSHQEKTTHAQSGDCITCHMPKRRADDVVHAVMTDHNIQRRKPSRDLLAPKAEDHGNPYRGEVVLYYPDDLPAADRELYLGVGQVTQGSNIRDGVQRLRAAIEKYRPQSGFFYFELAKATEGQQAISLYRGALERMPEYWPAAHRLGLLEQSTSRLELAAAQSNNAIVFNDLGLLYQRQGKLAQAIVALRRAVALDSDLAHAHNNLGTALAQSGDLKAAEEAFVEAIRLQPDLSAARANLARLRQ